jgi:ABC-type multidrug transport system permease subunit
MKSYNIVTAAAIVAIVFVGQAAFAQSQPAPVPEPSTFVAGALLVVPLAVGALRTIRKKK